MSGIFGFYERHGARVDSAGFERTAGSLEALGRDGWSSTGTESVRFGHRLMDRGPAGRVPCGAVHHEGPDIYLTGDIRLDNRKDRAAELGLGSAEARITSDSGLVATAYERWGLDCPSHLLGDFAFAIWDQEQRRLVLARDHFGIRPLFYTTTGSCFCFSSAIRGLLSLPKVSRDLSPFMVARYLLAASDAGGPTLYKSIHSLLPSHCLVVEADREPRLIRYWQPDVDARIQLRDDREYVEAFREILFEAVRVRLDSTSRVGILVSGGLDSSTIASVASDLGNSAGVVGVGHVVEPFSAAADLDERRYLEALENHIPQLDLRYVTAPGASPLGAVDQVHRCLRLPVQAGLNYVLRALFEESRQAGCGVVLMGVGGDEVASAQCGAYLSDLFKSLRLRRFVKEFTAERSHLNVSRLTLWRRTLVPLLPRPIRHALHYQRHGYFGYFRTCLREAMARELDMRSVLNGIGGWWDVTGYGPPSVRGQLFDTLRLMSSEGLDAHNQVTEGADYGLSVRFPLADVRLIEYCMAIPIDQLRRKGVGRLLMRRAAEHLLPDLIRQRRDKCVFGPDYLLRVQADLGQIRQAVKRFSASDTFRRYVDLDCLGRTIDRVSVARAQSSDTAWDCLGSLLPACYLGIFLELEDAVR